EQRLLAEEADVAPTVTDQHQQRVNLRVSKPLRLDQLERGEQPVRQCGGTAYAQPLESTLRQVDARGRTKDHPGVTAAERNQCHLVAADIRMPEQRADGTL